MNNCCRCIMEHADGLVLVEPTIFIVEGDYINFSKQDLAVDEQKEEYLSPEDDDCPF